MTDGWFHTGDLGYVDEDGFFFVIDRKKEMIIRGGENVYPREVEDALCSHPAVAEAAVIGVPDDRLGQEVRAVVALRPGRHADETELIAYVRERVASYKYPRSIEFREHLGRAGGAARPGPRSRALHAGRLRTAWPLGPGPTRRRPTRPLRPAGGRG